MLPSSFSSPQRSLGDLLGLGVAGSTGCEDLEAEVSSSIFAFLFRDRLCDAVRASEDSRFGGGGPDKGQTKEKNRGEEGKTRINIHR